jgi:hypothetical protein
MIISGLAENIGGTPFSRTISWSAWAPTRSLRSATARNGWR